MTEDPGQQSERKPVKPPAEASTPPRTPAEEDKIYLVREEYAVLMRKVKTLEEREEQLLRSAADFDNAKKRLVKERDEFFKFVLEATIHDLLPVLDNLERALAHAELGPVEAKTIRDGFSLVHKQFMSVLRDRGLRRLEVVGKTFDPNQHEAVEHQVSQDQEEGVILEEVLAGYELNGKLIRPAKVKITTRKVPGPEEKDEELT